MSQQNDSGYKTFTTSAAVGKFRRVVLASDGTVSEAVVGATSTDFIGVAQDNAASGDPVVVKLKSAPGTFKIEAAGAVVAAAAIYAASTGRIDDAVSGAVIGQAIEAAGAAGDYIECTLAVVP